jgi:hypothetical protein
LPSGQLDAGGAIVFTFLWQARWEGKDFQVGITPRSPTTIERRVR